jgi:hypothetical protein
MKPFLFIILIVSNAYSQIAGTISNTKNESVSSCNVSLAIAGKSFFLSDNGEFNLSTSLAGVSSIFSSLSYENGAVSFSLDVPSSVQLRLHNVLGKMVEEYQEQLPAGSHNVRILESSQNNGPFILSTEINGIEQDYKLLNLNSKVELKSNRKKNVLLKKLQDGVIDTLVVDCEG